MFFTSRTARPVLAAVVAIAATGANVAPASAAFFQLPHFSQPIRSPLLNPPGGIANWTRLHTEAPSQFHPPLGGFNTQLFGHRTPVGNGFFNGAAADRRGRNSATCRPRTSPSSTRCKTPPRLTRPRTRCRRPTPRCRVRRCRGAIAI